ncbi:hypothetical protein F5B20DRAFT_586158 [Whalleya microplaca]|nr:hypothetical protein F5B20DRAFT_586158 [Whalleya microplaca]
MSLLPAYWSSDNYGELNYVAKNLANYFYDRYRFEFVQEFVNGLLYCQEHDPTTRQVLRRLCIKYTYLGPNTTADWNAIDRDLDEEERAVLAEMRGAEHICQLLTMTGDRDGYDDEQARIRYPTVWAHRWFAMEFIPGGTLGGFINKNRGNGKKIREETLWVFFLCPMAYPPNAPEGTSNIREEIPNVPGRPGWAHGDLHTENIMLDESISDDEHLGLPRLKLIDFEFTDISRYDNTSEENIAKNLYDCAMAILSLAVMENINQNFDKELRPTYRVYKENGFSAGDEDDFGDDVFEGEEADTFRTWAEPKFRDLQLSSTLTSLVSRCTAVQQEDSPGLEEVLAICVNEVAKIGNDRTFVEEFQAMLLDAPIEEEEYFEEEEEYLEEEEEYLEEEDEMDIDDWEDEDEMDIDDPNDEDEMAIFTEKSVIIRRG